MKQTLTIIFTCLSLAASAQKSAPRSPVKVAEPINDTTKIASLADISKFIDAVRSQPHSKFVTFTVDDILASLIRYVNTLKP